MARRKLSPAVAAILVPLVGGFEGVRQYAYRDPVGIPTICMGETKNVRMGMFKTIPECNALLLASLEEHAAGMDRCLRVDLPEKRYAAALSFTYNAGVGAFCGSTFARKLNDNDPTACAELSKWNKATKAGVRIVLPGLTRRRAAERDLCEAA